MKSRLAVLVVPFAGLLAACPPPPCESVFDCEVGQVCTDGACTEISPEPEPNPTPADAGLPEPDGGVSPEPVPDDGGTSDAGVPDDAGLPDGGPDAGEPDANTPDSGVPLEIVSFTVDGATTTQVNVDATVTLAWSVAGAATCAISANVGEQIGVVDANQGIREAVVAEGTTFVLTCEDAVGATVDANVGVFVTVITRFDADNTAVDSGQPSTLTWTTSDAASCMLNGTAVAANGTQVVNPTVTTTYTLACTGPGGNVSALTDVAVNGSAVISTFTIDDAQPLRLT